MTVVMPTSSSLEDEIDDEIFRNVGNESEVDEEPDLTIEEKYAFTYNGSQNSTNIPLQICCLQEGQGMGTDECGLMGEGLSFRQVRQEQDQYQRHDNGARIRNRASSAPVTGRSAVSLPGQNGMWR